MNKTNNNLVTVGIPIYKANPCPYELYSFERCCKVLGKYPFAIITHNDLDTVIYTDIMESFNVNFTYTYFDRTFFKDTNGYNRLMVSPSFYKKYSAFTYLLIYQLDAFVFSDQLSEWCAKDYDYIGAPWLNVKWINNKEIHKNLPLFTKVPWLFKILKGKDGLVGNGGFSLRKISSHIKFAKVYSSVFSSLNINEDLFWGKYVSAKEKVFKVPLLQEALSFSIENDPAVGFGLLNNQLPFGCHAWFKNDVKSWQIIFKKSGIDISRILNA